jgi:RNA polymerase sigma factor (sigma-70 family)
VQATRRIEKRPTRPLQKRARTPFEVSDDADLYAAWRQGDKQAGQALIERYYDAVLRFFRTKVGAQADDLVQRTFLACSEGGFRGESSFRSYLFGIARNVLLKFFRGNTKDAKVDPDFTVQSIYELAPGPSTIAAKRIEQRLLIEALRRIPLEFQVLLELFYWEELSIAELSAVLELPDGTIKSRLRRGRALIKEALERLPASPDEEESVRMLLGGWVEQMQVQARELV